MKYVVILGDGMADLPISELGGKTPLEAADKPQMNFIAAHGELGLVHTVPAGMSPASDVANLSVMGYDPKKYYSGRSPLEAVSMGVQIGDDDVTFRCNVVTLSNEAEYSKKTMLDYSAGEITTEEARELISAVSQKLSNDIIKFYGGISYRHLMVWNKAPLGLALTPPHDITDKPIASHLPDNEIILDLMGKSVDILKDHPINNARVARGLRPANSIWLWGQGTRPSLPSFFDMFGVRGSVISAVDLIKGIGICAGMRSIDVDGATGNIHTNFSGKAEAAVAELSAGQEFVYVHIEAPDECGHQGQLQEKVRSIELIDKKIIAPILDYLKGCGEDFAVMLLPDHPTPISLRTHTRAAVPYAIYRSGGARNAGSATYDEACASRTGVEVLHGHELMRKFIR